MQVKLLIRRIVFPIFLFVHVNASAQQLPAWACGDDILTGLQNRQQPGVGILLQYKNAQLSDYIQKTLLKKTSPSFSQRILADSSYTIPVVIHIVHPPGEVYGTGTNISYAQVRSQLEALNAAFSRDYPAYNGQTHPGYAADTRIRFCLARSTMPDTVNWATGPGGIEYGVKRYADNSGAYNHDITQFSANQLLRITHPDGNHFPFEKYLNIWLVKTIGGGHNVIGYAPKPLVPGYQLDGIVYRADAFGDNTRGGNYALNFGLTQGKILAHEAGHYLNLYHIFHGGCAGANAAGTGNDACDLNGDFICDIEPALTQNVYCSGSYNTCNASYSTGTTNLDMINDYMSYADDDCMNTFTMDQTHRMWATLDLDRRALWQATNLAATGVLGTDGCVPPYLNAVISASNTVICVSKGIDFSNPAAGNTATTYQWQFPGGTPAIANTNTATVSYASAGNYVVSLTVSDGVNTRKDSLLINVVTCKLDSANLHMANWYFGDYCSVNFSSGVPIQTNTALANNSIRGESVYPGQLPYIHATTSLSDSLGNLLFYSNAVSVWNKEHKKINTAPIFGISDINASSGVCYIPYPGHPGKYFIVGVFPNFDETPSGVRFVMVDITADSVGAYKEFSHALLPRRYSEYLTVVPHCNGSDYWIIARAYGLDSDNRCFSFLVTAAGIDINQAPVVSSGFLQPAYVGAGYQLKANRKGDKLIITSPHPYPTPDALAALYDFDSRTGQIKNERLVPDVAGYNNIQTGTAFSPNGEYFYLMRSTNLATNGPPYWLFQYRVSNFQYTVIPTTGFYFGSPFQVGPDDQLYIVNGLNYLARFAEPDKWGGSGFDGEFMSFAEPGFSRHIRNSLPAFIDARQPSPTRPDFSFKASNCSTYTFTSLCFDDYTASWNFGDGLPVTTGHTVTHSFISPAQYAVTLTLSKAGDTVGQVTKNINVLPLTVSITGPGDVCTNGSFPTQYYAPVIPGITYQWTPINGDIIGPDNLPFVDIAWRTNGAAGEVILYASRDSCTIRDIKTVKITAGPMLNWTLKDSACINDSSFALNATPTGGTFQGPGIINNRFSPSAAGEGIHTISYFYTNETSCPGRLEKRIKINNCNIPVSNNLDCEQLFKSIQIMPNPVNEQVEIKSPYAVKYAQVYNLIGQKLTAGELVNNKLRLPYLSSGYYFLLVYCNNYRSFRAYKFYKL